MKLLRKIKRLLVRTQNPDILREYGAKVGKNVVIWTNKIDLGHAFLLEIGNNVTISDARILLHDASTKIGTGYSRVGKVKIGNEVFIGADAIILPNVTIGNKVIIGAGTIVTKNIPDNSVVVGNPGKIIGTYDDYIKKNLAEIKKGSNVYHTYWKNKTEDEKKIMSEELEEKIGYDI